MCHANNEKRETTPDGQNGTTKSRKNQNARKKGNLQILGNMGSLHHQTTENERKKSRENEKSTRNQTILPEFYKRDKYQGCSPRDYS